MKRYILLFTCILVTGIITAFTQNTPAQPTSFGTGTYWGVSRPLRDIPPLTQKEFRALERKCRKMELNEGLQFRSYPFAATALPKGEDPAWQKNMGTTGGIKAPIVNFEGQTSPYYPPDCNGTPGQNHFMQTINTVYAIYDKTGTLVAGPTNINQIFGSVPGANRNDGDPIILYDDQADRWLVTEFSIPYSGPNYIMMAVSTTNDPTGTWHQYSFQVDAMPDYPKFSVWRDGYYMGDNNNGGNDIYVFERAQMLTGGTAHFIGFNNPWRPGSVDGFMCVPPVDNDGEFAPVNAPGMYIAFNDDAFGGGSDQLWLYELHTDWTTPSNSTFNRIQQLDVQPFSANFGPTWDNISQQGTSQKLDGIPQVIMNVPQYRNFGSYQTIVCCHTVNLDASSNHAGIRWYELRKSGGTWSIRQQGTYAPDANSRWMGSIMLNGHNKIALGYSVSSTTMHPSIRYCGQSPAEYNAGSSILDIAEDTIIEGENSQTAYNRWGDYSLMSIDPTDDETFWFTDQYIGSGGSRRTRIASFKFITGPAATTLPATNITGISATLNGMVNPQGLSTSYHFEYGTNPFYLNDSTPMVNIGSGSSNINVSANIAGLQSNKTYYFRVVASNNAGPSFGMNLSFTTGEAPLLVVSPPNQNVPAAPDSTRFIVTSNISWSVSSDSPWCTVTPSGTGNDTIRAICTENTVVEQRVATIIVSGDGVASQTVTVTQGGVAPFLLVTPPNQNVDTISDTTHFTVHANTMWSVVSDATWCVITPTGSGNGMIDAIYTENLSTDQRIATITVNGTTGLIATVTVTQSGVPLALAVTPPNRNVLAQAGSTTFDVTSNTSWSVSSDAPWCTITPSGSNNGTIVADFTENTTDQPRIANIGVTASGLPVQSVSVTQARYGISVEEHYANEIRIYPNPNKGIFRIVPPAGNREELTIKVEDLKGRVILSKSYSGESEYLIDLSSASEGCYNIIIRTTAKLVTRKLIIIK